jgi:hypothetical protein
MSPARHRSLLAGLAFVVASIAVWTPASTAAGVEAGSARYAPSTVPAGWYVWGATAPAAGEQATGGFTFYARDRAPGSGPALAVGSMPRDGFSGLRDASPRAVRGLASGRRAHNGDVTWVTWLAPGGTDVRVVAARGLDDDAVVAAARAARFPTVGPPTVGGTGVPDGLTRLVVDAGIGPDAAYPAEQIVLVDGTGGHRITLDVFAADSAERAFVQFWADQEPRRGNASGARTRAAVAQRDGHTVVARGAVDPAVLRALTRATSRTDDAGWEAFRARVADLPVAAFFPQVDRANGAVLDGASAGTRWAVGWDRGAAQPSAWNMLLTADGTQGGGGTGLPDTGLPDVASSGTILGHGGMLFAGIVPATAAVARFEPVGHAPVTATVGPLTPDGAHRYFAAWVPGLDGTSPLVVFDAAGTEIARRTNFGCNTCS